MSWHQAKPSFLPLGSKSQLQRANNSLKPSPLRGLGAVWQACTPRRGRKAARLSSGVSPQKKWFSAKSFFFFAKGKELLCPTLARAPAYLGPDTPPPGGTSLGFKPKPIIQAFGGNSRLQWANNSLKPSPLRGLGAVWPVRSGFRIKFDLMKRYIKYGLPSGLQETGRRDCSRR